MMIQLLKFRFINIYLCRAEMIMERTNEYGFEIRVQQITPRIMPNLTPMALMVALMLRQPKSRSR